MNVQDFTYLLQHPDKVVSNEQTKQLEDVIIEYPYFQAARSLYLKGLKNGNSFKYNSSLKATAAYTTDRGVLFDFITSKEFLQNSIADSIRDNTNDPEDNTLVYKEDTEAKEKSQEPTKYAEVETLNLTKDESEKILDPKLFKSKDPFVDQKIEKEKELAASELELGQPLPFTKKEKHSFGEWLQLTTLKTAERGISKKTDKGAETAEKPKGNLKKAVLKKKNFERIDKFLNENPKIVPQENTVKVDIDSSLRFDKNELMTETLAKVYLEQKKYKNAIQAYKILSLKYPEKSGFFADRIKAVEKIQKDNTEE